MAKKKFKVRDNLDLILPCNRCKYLFAKEQLRTYFQYKRLCPECLEFLDVEDCIRRDAEYENGIDLEYYEENYDE